MKTYEIYHQSLEFLPVGVDAEKEGLPYDPSGDTVSIACVPVDTDPDVGDFKIALWDLIDDDHVAKILVGPGAGSDLTLDVGHYDVYVQIGDSPEVPIIRVGLLVIT